MIRLGTIIDKNSVLSIYEDAKTFIRSYDSPQWQNGYPNLDTFNNDLQNNRLYVYEIDNKVVACASFYQYDNDYDQIYEGNWLTSDTKYIAIHTIATLKDYHGQGISNKFFNYVFDNFDINSIRIDTHELNIPMIKMLTKSGFHYCGIVYLGNKLENKRLAFERLKK